ncbi:MAG: toxin [Gammaproteobacteria bacterium]|nr:toxin [Gammaproteobacteria bacterium]
MIKKTKAIRWNEEKNSALKKERNISFEVIFSLIEDGLIADIRDNPGYPSQNYYFFDIDDYIYCVPVVETEDEIFLKTIFPSRKFTKQLKRD